MSTCIAGHGYYLNMNGCPDCAPKLGDLAPLPATDETETCWRRDMTNLNAALHRLGAVITEPDGWQGIDPGKAPANLLTLYSDLTSVGYAKGWI